MLLLCNGSDKDLLVDLMSLSPFYVLNDVFFAPIRMTFEEASRGLWQNMNKTRNNR